MARNVQQKQQQHQQQHGYLRPGQVLNSHKTFHLQETLQKRQQQPVEHATLPKEHKHQPLKTISYQQQHVPENQDVEYRCQQQQKQPKGYYKNAHLNDEHETLSLYPIPLVKCPLSTHRYVLGYSGVFVTIFQLLLLLMLSHSNVEVLAEGNVGCHFVRTLCLQGSEVCFDDNIFGKCIPTSGVDVEDIEKTPLTTEQSRYLATLLEELQGVGLGWDHPYVQCRVQGTLFSLQKQTTLPPNLCANLAPMPAIDFDSASALAFVPFTPPLENRDIAQELDGEEALFYYPPLKKQQFPENGISTIFRRLQLQDRQLRHDPLELAHFEKHEPPPSNVPVTQKPQSVMDVFLQSERNRIHQEQEQRDLESEAERTNAMANRVELYQMLAASEPDPQPYQRNPPSPPTLSPIAVSALDKLERLVEKDTAPSYIAALELDDSNEQYFPEHYKPFKRYGKNQHEKQSQHSFFRELAGQEGLKQEQPLDRQYYSHTQLSQPLSSEVNWLTTGYKRMSKNSFNMAEEPKSDEVSFNNNILEKEDDIGKLLRENDLTRNSLTPFQQEAMLASNIYDGLQSNKQHAPKKPERVFTEAGLVYVSDADSAADVFNNELQQERARELLENMFGFKRRERLDVKKPGPLVGPPDNQVANNNNNKTNNEQQNKAQTKEVLPAHIKGSSRTHRKKNVKNHSDEDHAPHTVDTEYAHVYVKNPIDSWNDGVRIMNELANILHMQGYFTYLTVQQHLVSFRVDSNNPERKTATDVARAINENRGVKNNILRRLGVTVVNAGVGDKIRANGGYEESVVSSSRVEMAERSANMTHIMAYMLAGAGAAAVIVIFITLILIKRHDKTRDKLGGIQTSISGAESCGKDYQELCRARMSGKVNVAESATCGRLTSLSKENDRPPSSRSSTSSWSEEPALTNMDISTGHMVLSYMEDHLRNKGRLQREWEALCRYEAEPSARDAAQQPQCINLNRSNAPLPYDHSRVVLNHLANAEGLDYINASTITDHDPRAPAYIAAQGPLPTTLAHFWQMIWEQGAVVIVALCRLQENGEISCARYWPEEGAEVYHIYEVHLVSEHIWCDDYLVRSFYLKNLRTSETRTVTQFHFLSWPQGGVPAQAKALLDFRRKVNKSYRGRSCPIVVHGSTGAGRAGAYILLDLVLGRMNKGAREIDIAATLEHLRDQRASLVETRQQFEFVLMAVAEEVHAILKALPANTNEKRDIEVKDAAKATSTATVASSVLVEEDDTELASSNNNKEKRTDPATSKEKDKNTTTNIPNKDNKEKEKSASTPAKSKKK